MSSRISSVLNADKPVLWLICGGSNIPLAVAAFGMVKSSVSKERLVRLTVAQTDERYGPVGHEDSNWQQMIDAGFDLKGVKAVPVLTGESLNETGTDYAAKIGIAMDDVKAAHGLTIALFGIGSDGHIAGMLPHSPAVSSTSLATGYVSEPFTRVTLTPPALRKIDVAYVFAFGDSKKKALQDLQDKELALEEEPAQILKSLGEAHVYSDQLS